MRVLVKHPFLRINRKENVEGGRHNMQPVLFGKISIMRSDVAENLKHIRTLPQRDAFVGSVGPHDPELAKGNYDWWTLPDKSMMYVTGEDRDAFRRYSNDNPVKLPAHRDEEYYAKLSQRAQNFVDSRAREDHKVYYMPRLSPWESLTMQVKKAIRSLLQRILPQR
jgi:hypothetical protein